MQKILTMEIRIFDRELEKFIQSLEKSTIAKALRTVDLLKIFGSRLGMPHSKKVADRLFELRIRGSQEVRIFYTFNEKSIVLLCGFVKKSDKIPRKEINIAINKLRLLDTV
ncbi:MAG: type II toxin-antitoxin system RelE/ParE family toxin [bacterium]|nr:type II toxin-antitoxin system RelE/ParE family toxin [bacterium]